MPHEGLVWRLVQAFVEAALAGGYAALRMASEVHALVGPDESVEETRAREGLATELTATLPVTGVCLCDRRAVAGAYLLAAEREHDPAVDVDPLYADDLVTLTLTLSRDRNGRTVRAAGEIDSSNAAGLRRALDLVIAEGIGGVTLDVAELGFIDVAGLRVIAEAAISHPERSLCLQGAQPSLTRVLSITGWGGLANLVVIPAGGDR